MSKRTQVALEKQLIRELHHRVWLAQHLPNTKQQQQSQRKTLVIRTALALKLGRAVER
tara:strand:- start:927 stop:1100 length:174 start_codon:yes stop_codon:yes gene_type:complete